MKIVAAVNSSKFLVEIDAYELNKISGLDRATYNPYKIGEVISIEKTWRFLKGILAKKKELLIAAQNLHSMANMLELVQMHDEESLSKEDIE